LYSRSALWSAGFGQVLPGTTFEFLGNVNSTI
jgi:hypothetical protein